MGTLFALNLNQVINGVDIILKQTGMDTHYKCWIEGIIRWVFCGWIKDRNSTTFGYSALDRHEHTYLSCHYDMPRPTRFGGAFLCPQPSLIHKHRYTRK